PSCSTGRRRYANPSRAMSSIAPPVSCATSRSSGLIALAIHVTWWCETRLRRAVTRPPPPRRAVRLPAAPRAKVTGPRLETTISFRCREATAQAYPWRALLLVAADGDELAPGGLVACEPVEQR